jgi:hypothetical protein
MPDADGMRCEPVTDDNGEVVAVARVSGDLGEEGRRALLHVVEAARRLQAEQDAADPAGAAERAQRQAAAIARVRERAGLRVEDEQP